MSQIRTILMALLGLFLLNMLMGENVRAEPKFKNFNFSERAEKREASRWTLSEWLEQRDRNRMMDLWLSMNSPSPFEFMLSVSSISYKNTTSAPTAAASSEISYTSSAGEVRAYAQLIGLTAEYEHNVQEGYNDLTGLLNLRLMGDSLQNSSLTIHGGQRVRSISTNGSDNVIRNILTQVSLQLYFSRYFGIDSFYRRYEPINNDVLKASVSGSQAEAGLFIDFSAVRVFGAWYQDIQKNDDNTTHAATQIRREGVKAGLKFFY